ncbi:MAG: hydroxymethylbilane synthase, partial [Bdellovibrionaceae bacterium]|nr:hydroxymethylbilane synthase [Pseudobdellovibrionaceae bacterium]
MSLAELNISSRKSDLARLQSFLVGEALEATAEVKINYHFKESLGDINLIDPLWKIPQKGVFTEDFTQDLLEMKTDMVVHSWKDLPTEKKKFLQIAATLPRADQRDLLLVKKSSFARVLESKSIRLFSSSPRRFYNVEPFLKSCFPFGLNEVHFENVRGNIPTRLNKLVEAENIDGLVLAKAALDRLVLTHVAELQETKKHLASILTSMNWMVLPLSENPNAAAQGAIAIEINSQSLEILHTLQKINDPETFHCSEKERLVLSSYGGGCHQKIGIAYLKHTYGHVQFLKGLTDGGEILNQKHLIHPAQDKVKHKFSPALMWSDSASNKYFNRIDQDWSVSSARSAFFVTKASCVNTDSIKKLKNSVVWTAGMATWKKMAERGVWVNGTQDGLGEHTPMRSEALVSPNTDWHKLTHADSGDGASCYKLIRNENKF